MLNKNQKFSKVQSSLFGNLGNGDKDKYPSRSQQPSSLDKQQQFQEQQEDAVEKGVLDYTNSLRRTVTALKDVRN